MVTFGRLSVSRPLLASSVSAVVLVVGLAIHNTAKCNTLDVRTSVLVFSLSLLPPASALGHPERVRP